MTLTEKDKESYESDLYMKNLPERDVYVNLMKDAGFTDIQVCWVINLFSNIPISFLLYVPVFKAFNDENCSYNHNLTSS